MKAFLIFLFFSILLTISLFAQSDTPKSEIQGMVVDSVRGKPLRMASISLLTARDSGYVTATITDGDGRFRLRNVAIGHYRLLITFLGYQNASQYVTISRETLVIDAGTVRMSEQTNLLQEVVVRQESAPVTVRQDTVEFNANSFKTQPNAQVEELLRKLPGVDVARDGTIRAQGQAVNRVLVDGKPFFGNDPKMATRNLPADIVDKVQLYDQSSDQSQFSGIDDGNRERTINLTLKPDKRKGYFGQNAVGLGTARDGGAKRYQSRLNLNRFNNRENGPGRQLSLVGQANNLNQQNFTLQDGASGGGAGGPVLVGSPGGVAPGTNQTPTNIIETKAIGANYRDKWGSRAEVATSYFLNQATTTTDQKSRRESILPGQAFITDQSNYSQNRQTNHRLNGRIDWQLDSLTSLRILPNVSWQNTGYDSRLDSRTTLPAKLNSADYDPKLLNTGETIYAASGNNLTGYNNLLLMRKFRREGRTLSLNLNTTLTDGQTNALNQSANTFYDSTGFTPPGSMHLDQRNRQTSYSLQNTLTFSYTEPLSLTRKIEFQYAYLNSYNRADRTVNDMNAATGQYDKLNPMLSNRFSSLFATHRAGATLQTRRLRYTYALGLDFQEATLQVENRSADTSQSHSYMNLLPNALFSYTLSRNRSIRLQYRTRLTAPSVTQLQPVVDNTNPLAIWVGNPMLRPEFYHTLTLTYNGASGLSNRSLFVFASLNQSANRIGTATTLNESGVQTTLPVNAGGYWTASGFMSLGRFLQSLKLNVTLTTNAGFTRALSFVNDQTNASRTVSVGQGLRLQSAYNEKIDYGLSGTINYQSVTYSLLPKQNVAFWSQYATADLHWELPFRFVLTSDLTYTATSGQSAGYNQQFLLWNVALSKQLFKAKQGELRVQIFDLLNQNRSLIRNTSDAYIEDVQSQVLRRYGLLSFFYNLRKFGV